MPDYDNVTNLGYYQPPLMSIPMYESFVEGMILTSGKDRLIENTLGLAGESGEVAEKIKKAIRDDTLDREAVLKELGDVLFYVTAMSNYFNSSLQEVMDLNMQKLNSRRDRNKLQGSGDNR